MIVAEALAELERLLLPLEEDAIQGIVTVAKALAGRKAGVALTAKRIAEELAFEAEIQS